MTAPHPADPRRDDAPFEPTAAAAQARLQAVDPEAYARSRNALGGAVTRLSPYVTHGLLTLPEVLANVAARHRLTVAHKFVFELGWREYFHHQWAQHGAGVFDSLRAGPLPDDAYADAVPPDVREARTGVPAIDAAVCTLYASGYLHNHARLWLASYLVHLRKVHWRAGADWLYGHLLDGDLASNHLSWQWVAGTGSSKPYLFNAENVARHAPPSWRSPGSVIDAGYAALEAIAHRREAVPGGASALASSSMPAPANEAGLAEPRVYSQPPARFEAVTPDAGRVQGRHVWLVHPWALREAPPDLPADTSGNALRIGVLSREFHQRRPWSAARWDFVLTRLRTLCDVIWCGDDAAIGAALAGAASVQAVDDPHLHDALSAWARLRPVPRLFGPVAPGSRSFSQWWTRATHGLDRVEELPGLAARHDTAALARIVTPIHAHDPRHDRTPDDQPDLFALDRHRPGDRRTRWHRP